MRVVRQDAGEHRMTWLVMRGGWIDHPGRGLIVAVIMHEQMEGNRQLLGLQAERDQQDVNEAVRKCGHHGGHANRPGAAGKGCAWAIGDFARYDGGMNTMPTATGDGDDPSAQAESLFAEYLLRVERGEPGDFEQLCRQRPDLEEHLRPMERMLSEFRRAVRPLAEPDAQRAEPESRQDYPISRQDHPILEQLGRRATAANRYTVQEEIGRGGMGVILKAWDPQLRRHLALKRLRVRSGADRKTAAGSQSLGRFLDEAQVTGQLEHPGIVPVHELGLDEDGQVFFTMRLVDGVELTEIFARVARREPGWTRVRALGLLQKACEAVAFAHSKGVIHRDLKPQNLMVGSFGETYVMDWGLARVLDRRSAGSNQSPAVRPEPGEGISTDGRQGAGADRSTPAFTLEGTAVGTPAYMPPEQAAGRLDDLGPTADVYAMGSILYHLLAGQAPYLDLCPRSSPHEVLKEVIAGPPTKLSRLRPDVPPELEAICERAMAREIERRYPTMETLSEDLRAYLEQRVVRAYASGPMAELKKWVLRNRSLAATLLAAFLTIATVTWWSFVNVREERNLAQANEQAASAERRRVLQLSDVRRYADLMAEIDELWPAQPDMQPRFEDWLARASRLIERRADHERTLAQLRARGVSPEAGPGAAVDFGDDTETRWWYDTLSQLIRDLNALEADDPYGETLASVRARLDFAAKIRKWSIDFYREEWDEALSAIADPERAPAYGGLVLTEQLGLVPLGPDPHSGLWEFWQVQSGARPERDGDERLVLTPDSGLVLVLLPGGSFHLGCQSGDPGGPNYDPRALGDESGSDGRPVRVTLDPFFMAKYELTQGQWLHIMGQNPSAFTPGESWGDATVTLRNPVEQVSWYQARDLLKRLGLLLPTEAQWEYACRGGTDTVWWTGDDPSELASAANLADRSYQRLMGVDGLAFEAELDDGFCGHAPVGRYRANPFGLHDMHGNLWEWCRDRNSHYDTPFAAGDGLRIADEPEARVIRGGDYTSMAVHVRSATRTNSVPDYGANMLGFRASRPLSD